MTGKMEGDRSTRVAGCPRVFQTFQQQVTHITPDVTVYLFSCYLLGFLAQVV